MQNYSTNDSSKVINNSEEKIIHPRFAALDFETANYASHSACAISIILVENGQIIHSWSTLIKPPSGSFVFTYIHGITAKDVQNSPTFIEIYPQICELLEGAEFIVAHNAPFDKGVMNATCGYYGLPPPLLPWKCTVKMARAFFNIRPTKLNNVCSYFNIPLKHHDALSDATACAKIMLECLKIPQNLSS